jgi:antibiotic biosynthesis monooxygenase (ABM) superfamily enzyme
VSDASPSEYVELARFRLKADVTREQFLAAEEGVRRGFLKDFPGYLSRELYRSDGGEWVVILRFTDKVSMDALLERLRSQPDETFGRYGRLIDRETMRTEFVHRQM